MAGHDSEQRQSWHSDIGLYHTSTLSETTSGVWPTWDHIQLNSDSWKSNMCWISPKTHTYTHMEYLNEALIVHTTREHLTDKSGICFILHLHGIWVDMYPMDRLSFLCTCASVRVYLRYTQTAEGNSPSGCPHHWIQGHRWTEPCCWARGAAGN